VEFSDHTVIAFSGETARALDEGHQRGEHAL
jgi:hypothetical protein